MAIRGFVLQVIVLGYSLIAGAFYSNPPSLASEREGLARLAIAVGAGMLALAVGSRGLCEPELSPSAFVLDLVVAYGGVLISQVILGWLEPNLVLPRWAPTQGGYVGAILFGATRALLASNAAPDCITPTSSGAWAKEVAAKCRRIRTRYGVAGSIALTLGLVGVSVASTQVRLASSLIAIGSAYLLVRAVLAPSPRAENFVDLNFSRSGEILRAAARWYYAVLFPATLVALFGSKVYPYWIPLVILLFAEANERLAASLVMCGPSRFVEGFEDRGGSAAHLL